MTSATAQQTTTQVYRVYIKATAEAVWDAITKPEWTERFGYGGRAEYDLRPGGVYRGHTSEEMRAQGAPDVGVDGEVLEVDPPRRLVQTFRMLMDPDIAGEGFSKVTYELDPTPTGATRLTVVHELDQQQTRLSTLMSGGLEAEGAGGGWAFVLSDLKSVLETGEGIGGW
jgi:uncharacterized protein YndB with AHSA1/START domain